MDSIPYNSSFPSPPESQAGSPASAEMNSIEKILSQLLPIIRGLVLECEVDGVTPALLAELQTYMSQTDLRKAAGAWNWDKLLFDYRPNKLIVRLPAFGVDVLSSLFFALARSGSGPDDSTTFSGGSREIHYHGGGYRSPDSSLYEFKDNKGRLIDSAADATTPTVVFEVAYKTSRDLAMEAARHICLTMGLVLLVVVIDVVHEPRVHPEPRVLRSVTWSHWEEDIRAHHEVESQGAELNVVHVERLSGEDDAIHSLPFATAFSAKVRAEGEKRTFNIRATQTESWELFPNPQIHQIDILNRQLHRDPDESNWASPAFSINVSDIMAAIHKYEPFYAAAEKRDSKTRKRWG